MKTILASMLLLFTSLTFARLNTSDIQGTFEIKGVDVPYRAEITLGETMGLPTIRFTEKMGEDFECKGFYSVSYGTTVDATMYCGDLTDREAWEKMMRDEPADFTQEIDLSGVTKEQLNTSFKAIVKSSLYENYPVLFNFKRVQ